MALDPEGARNIPAHLIALYTDAELALLRLLAEAIADGIDTDQWQQVQASRQAEFRQAAEALARHLQAAMPPLLQDAVQAAADLGEQAADEDADNTPEPPEAVSVAATGTAATVAGSAPRRDRPRNPRTVAATQSAWSTLARTTQLLPANADRLYGQVLAQIQVRSPDVPRLTPHTGGILGAPRATGTRLDAAQQALDILTKRGITGFRDRGGRNWSLTSYVEMLSRTVVNEELREAHIARALEHGHTLMVVSSHSKPAPQCQPYEGQVLSLDGSTGTVELESATTGRPVRVTIKATMREAISNGFRHPNCFPADTRVSVPSGIRAADRRWYEGEIVVVHTASGVELSVTPNHPVLTPEGWVAAGLLNVGDNVFRDGVNVEQANAGTPDDQHVPARIGDVFDALRHTVGVTSIRVPSTPEQFHGDGGGSDVDVVFADRLLGDRLDAELGESAGEGELLVGGVRHGALLSGGSTLEVLKSASSAPDGVVSRSGLGGECFGGLSGSSDSSRFTGVASDDSTLKELPGDRALMASDAGADLRLGQAGLVELDGLVDPIWAGSLSGPQSTSVTDAPRDTSSADLLSEEGAADVDGGRDLVGRLSGEVTTDRVIHIERRDFAGHVYNLESGNGWYAADSLIVHNCGHALSRFVPGASRTFTTKPDPEGYAATQQQRAMERAIRDTRTRQAVAITPQAKRDTAARLRAQQAAIRQHVDEHGLTRRPRREQINRAR